jgi:hypothetical protein
MNSDQYQQDVPPWALTGQEDQQLLWVSDQVRMPGRLRRALTLRRGSLIRWAWRHTQCRRAVGEDWEYPGEPCMGWRWHRDRHVCAGPPCTHCGGFRTERPKDEWLRGARCISCGETAPWREYLST